MNAPRLFASALLVSAAAAFSLSCGDSTPTGLGDLKPQADLLGTLSKTVEDTGLLKCSPLPEATATATVGPPGGVIEVGPHKLSIPPGALTEWVTITAVAPSDKVNRVHFEPEGLEFPKPAALTMSYKNCNLLGSLAPKRIAYVSDALVILEYLLSVDDIFAKKVTGKLHHFSDYAIAW